MMGYLVIILIALLVIGGLGYLASLDGSYEVKRKILLNSDITTVFDKLRDFKTWSDWSPWLIHEPETQLEFSDDSSEEGGYYTWSGKRVGAGKLIHEKFDRPSRIDQRIEFTRPFKSVCNVAFELAEKGSQTEVVWIMRGRMPFLFRFAAIKTADMISKDYDLGLAMLAGQLDATAEHPVIRFIGETTLEPHKALCERFEGGLAEMETAMARSFPKLKTYVEENNGRIIGKPFSAYHKVDTKTMQFAVDMAIPVAEPIDSSDYQLTTHGGGDFYEVNVKGGYRFLELAWHAALAHLNMSKLKYDTMRPSLEVYENDPNELETSNDIETTIYVAIKQRSDSVE